MAGPFPRGGGDRFRDGIRFAMEMAAAPEVNEQVTFFFPSVLEFVDDEGPVDSTGVPFDADLPVQRVQPDPKRVACAVEYFDHAGQLTTAGTLHAARVAITLLDEEYAEVEGASYVVIDGDRYDYRRTQPPEGLFDVGLYTMHFAAEGET